MDTAGQPTGIRRQQKLKGSAGYELGPSREICRLPLETTWLTAAAGAHKLESTRLQRLYALRRACDEEEIISGGENE